MCGIMGLIGSSPSSEFGEMFATIAHRGPDASADKALSVAGWHARLGHHRLSVIDVAGGRQPMTSAGSTIVFNGEIYNFENLRKELPSVRWRTRSDTEVVLELVREQGPKALSLLDGFFAFGMFDESDGSLLLARDRWGIKPLYYAHLDGGGLLFASELHPFLKSTAVPKRVPLSCIADYLFWDYVPYDRTMLEGVYKLEPGHWLRWRDGTIELGAFYNPAELLNAPRQRVSADEVWDCIRHSVRAAMVSDVPVGIFLSGGMDSSLLAIAAGEIKGKGVPTFAIGFEEEAYDESPYARIVARHVHSDHHELKLSSRDLLERWEGIITALDEPLADPSLLPTRVLCELARRHVPVVLGGDGGDELYGGYPTYRAQRFRKLLDLIPGSIFSGLQTFTRDRLTLGSGYQPFSWKLKRMLGRYDQDPIRGHFRWMSGTDFPEIRSLTAGSAIPGLKEHPSLVPRDLQTYLYLDLVHYLPYSVLTKVDRASMAVGLECRPPLLSNASVEQAFRIPAEQKVSHAQTKIILRQAARKRVPEQIIGRPKRGFAIPLAAWLKDELSSEVSNMLSESPLWAPKALDRDSAGKLWREFIGGSGDYSKTFWALLVLHKWIQKHGLHIS